MHTCSQRGLKVHWAATNPNGYLLQECPDQVSAWLQSSKMGKYLIQFGHWLTQERENKAKCLFPVVAKANAAFPLPLFELFSMSLEMHFSTLPCSQKPWLSCFPVEPVAILYEIILLKTHVRPSVTNMITVNLILLVHCLYILFHIDISLHSLRAWLLGCATYVCDKQALFVCCMFVQYLAVWR